MDKTNTHPQRIHEFLSQALPKGQGGHVLALGEEHDHTQHIPLLHKQLGALVRDHNLGTIGLERPPYMSVFLWAYEDGTFEKMLGSQRQARIYLRQLLSDYSKVEYHENALQTTDLVMDAMQRGVRVALFDARNTLQQDREEFQEDQNILHETIANEARAQDQSEAQLRQAMRIDVKLQRSVLNKAAAVQTKRMPQDELKWLAEDNDVSMTRITQEWMPHFMRMAWTLDEIDALSKHRPVYVERLARLDRVIELGRDMDRPIGSDALSATLFDALAVPGKNSLTISGLCHVDGSGVPEKDSDDYIHGMFHNHLHSLKIPEKPPLQVQAAVVGNVGLLRSANQLAYRYLHQEPGSKSPLKSVNMVTPIKLMDVVQDRISALPEQNRRSLARKVMKGLPEFFPAELRTKDLAAQRVNPLLVPEIAQAAEAVRQDWNGRSAGRSR